MSTEESQKLHALHSGPTELRGSSPECELTQFFHRLYFLSDCVPAAVLPTLSYVYCCFLVLNYFSA
jgi:hypothetical protein